MTEENKIQEIIKLFHSDLTTHTISTKLKTSRKTIRNLWYSNFTEEEILQRNKDNILKGKEKNKHVKCKFCEKTFSTENQLLDHYKTTDEKEHRKEYYTEENSNDWIECKICGFRANRIGDHIKKQHNMEISYYKKNLGQIVCNSQLKKIKENGSKATDSTDQKNYNHPCKLCSRKINSKALICTKCKLKKAREKQELKFKGLVEWKDFVRCQCKLEDGSICNWPDTRLSKHITHHNYTPQLYREEFPYAELTSKTLKNKIAFSGPHSEKTKYEYSEKRKGSKPWNSGLTAEQHPSLKKIQEKAKLRFSILSNNNRHTNPICGERHGMTGKHSWSKGLTTETSEILRQQVEKRSGKYHHLSTNILDETHELNKLTNHFIAMQKLKIKEFDKICIECGSTHILQVHHILPFSLFNFYDISAHMSANLILLCDSCHSSKAQMLDRALIKSSCQLDLLKKFFPIEYDLYIKWSRYTNSRNISIFPIMKSFIQLLNEENKKFLEQEIFKELRIKNSISSNYNNSQLIKDFENIKSSSVKFDNISKTVKNYNTSGFKIKEHFIKEQYSLLEEKFNDDIILSDVIKNRLGFNHNFGKNKPEFFNIDHRAITRGFEVLFPKFRYSKYQCSIAKWILENYSFGNKIYDYSCGWGARLLATAALKKEYFGLDTNEKLTEELRELASWIKKNVDQNFEYKIINEDSGKYIPNNITTAYSCPPYGSQEKYKGSNYSSDEEWFEKFMSPVIKNCFAGLVKRGRFIVHISERYSKIIEDEASKYFTKIDEIYVGNQIHPFVNRKLKTNEVILIYEK